MSFSLLTKAFTSTMPPLEKIVLMELFNVGQSMTMSREGCERIAEANMTAVDTIYRVILDLHRDGQIKIIQLWHGGLPMKFEPGAWFLEDGK